MYRGNRGNFRLISQGVTIPIQDHYLGPCRCGFGPHAFHEMHDGRIAHVSQLYHSQEQTKLNREEEVKQLKLQAIAIREELKFIEKRLTELENKDIKNNK